LKSLLIILDGGSDRPNRLLKGKTPLQSANKPFLDSLSKQGINGLCYTIDVGIPPDSAGAHLSIFGYDPWVENPGRGLFESLGYNIHVSEGEVAFRVNFATGRGDWPPTIVDRRAGRISETIGKTLAEYINSKIGEIDGWQFKLYSTLEHRGVLIISGSKTSKNISDSDPKVKGAHIQQIKPLRGVKDYDVATQTAKILNKYLKEVWRVLSTHRINLERSKRGELPVNLILIRGPGKPMKLEKFSERWGFRIGCIAGGPLYKGVAKALGMDIIDVVGATGTINTNLDAKFRNAAEALKTYDMIFLHIKALDVASHDKQPLLKKELLERIDNAFSKYFSIGEDLMITVLPDHTTSSTSGHHTGDPVPMLMYSPTVRKDEVMRYDEFEAAKGSLHILKGRDIMPLILNYTDKAEEFGTVIGELKKRYKLFH